MDRYDKALALARSVYGTGAYDDATIEFFFPELTKVKPKSLIEQMDSLELWQSLTIEDNLSRRNTAQNYASMLKRYSGKRFTVRRTDDGKLKITREQ